MRKVIIILLLLSNTAFAKSRIKDISQLDIARQNFIVGSGIVFGLSGSGDNLKNSVFTEKGLMDFFERLGVNMQGANLKTKNIATVTVVASLPPFSRQGSKIDVKVSAVGDATSLKGGILLATPLFGADGNVYAVAQGQITIKNFEPSGEAVKTRGRAVETTGFIPTGAIIEKEVDFEFNNLTHVKLSLYNPDISTAISVANAINDNISGNTAIALDPGTVEITIPTYQRNNIVSFLSKIEQLEVNTDNRAQIIIDEATGTIVIGENVKIMPVAISQGNLVVTIGGAPNLNTPGVNKGMEVLQLQEGTNLKELVDALNSLGVWPRDLITILQTIREAGALQADIKIK